LPAALHTCQHAPKYDFPFAHRASGGAHGCDGRGDAWPAATHPAAPADACCWATPRQPSDKPGALASLAPRDPSGAGPLRSAPCKRSYTRPPPRLPGAPARVLRAGAGSRAGVRGLPVGLVAGCLDGARLGTRPAPAGAWACQLEQVPAQARRFGYGSGLVQRLNHQTCCRAQARGHRSHHCTQMWLPPPAALMHFPSSHGPALGRPQSLAQQPAATPLACVASCPTSRQAAAGRPACSRTRHHPAPHRPPFGLPVRAGHRCRPDPQSNIDRLFVF
jgi:hypothetical protein